MEKDELSPGTVLAAKYRLESVLGVGGMGTVYRAEHLALKAPVAVKVIDRKVEEGDLTLSRFMREAQSAAALRSPHVVQILDYGTDQGRPFMVMEMLEGEPLADRLKRVGHLPPDETYRIILHVAKAVSKAHEADIVHRDLKPDNIFLVHNEGDELAKVLDFGVAKVEATQLDGQGHTRTGSLLGTPYYMSPEQAQGNKDVDGRSDLWALGVIAFECMTGVRPFQSDGLGDLVLQICIRDIPIPSHFGNVPESFDEWFKMACQREPADRFQTARDLAEALRAALAVDTASIPESRWALPAERLHALNATAAETSEQAARDQNNATTNRIDARQLTNTQDGRTSVQSGWSEGDSQHFTAAPSSQRTPRKRRGSSGDWQVVPHGSDDNDFIPARHTRLSADPLGETLEIPVSTRLFSVAIFAIALGGAGVFGLREFGVISFGVSAQKDKPLKVISTGPSKIKKAPNKTLPDPEPPDEHKSATSKNKSDRDASKDTSADSRAASDEATNATADETTPLTDEQKADLQNLEAIAREAEQAFKQLNPAAELKPSLPGAGSKTPKKDGDSGPIPIVPDDLAPAPIPPPPLPAPEEN